MDECVGRELSMLAFGNTLAEIEMSALDEARAFFGDTWLLHIVPSYRIFDIPISGAFAEQYARQITGNNYYARITVVIVEK
jgi:hypothetical protein